MARTELTATPITAIGIDLTDAYEAAHTDGNKFVNHGHELIALANGSGVTRTLTVQTPAQTDDGLDIEERTVAVLAGTTALVGPFDPAVYNRRKGAVDAGSIYIDLDIITSVQVAIVRPDAY